MERRNIGEHKPILPLNLTQAVHRHGGTEHAQDIGAGNDNGSAAAASSAASDASPVLSACHHNAHDSSTSRATSVVGGEDLPDLFIYVRGFGTIPLRAILNSLATYKIYTYHDTNDDVRPRVNSGLLAPPNSLCNGFGSRASSPVSFYESSESGRSSPSFLFPGVSRGYEEEIGSALHTPMNFTTAPMWLSPSQNFVSPYRHPTQLFGIDEMSEYSD